MTNEQAKKMLKAKLECLKRETSGTDFDCNNSNCDECSLCYEQGNMGEQKEALDMAIKALEQTTWIPVSERLPEIKQHVLLSCYGRVIYGRMISEDGNSGYPVFEICDSVGEKRPIVLETTVHSEFTTSRIIAWMPLPEPYMGTRSDTSDRRKD
ncbi:MAG: DUF551 domain-containing protein [Roseburia faecis]|nr:DUF551 domain-containing protein [Roseburia faecis]